MRAATHEKHVQEPVPVDVSNPRVDVSNLRAPMFPALRRKTTVQILILILVEFDSTLLLQIDRKVF